MWKSIWKWVIKVSTNFVWNVVLYIKNYECGDGAKFWGYVWKILGEHYANKHD